MSDDIAIVTIDHQTRRVQTIAISCAEYSRALARTGDLMLRLPGWVVREHIRDEPVSIDELLTLAYGEPCPAKIEAPARSGSN